MLVVGTQTNDPSTLIKITFEGLLHHTLIVGQSGGGKSFLVARLIEEILLRSRARVLVIDPNGDFRQISRPSPTVWKQFEDQLEKINSFTKKSSLPTFDNSDDFHAGWEKRRFVYLSPGLARTSPRPTDLSSSLHVHWDTLAEEQRKFLLSTDARTSPRLFTGLMAVSAAAQWMKDNNPSQSFGFSLRGMREACEQFYQSNISMKTYDYAKLLRQEDWASVRATLDELRGRYSLWWSPDFSSASRPMGLADYIDTSFRQKRNSSAFWDALVLLLDASAPSDTLLAADVALERSWKLAKQVWREAAETSSPIDDRVPTFIVVDEAHNFAPERTDDPLRRRVTDRLLQIASEGRKYGLYLILATQRPTKLHRELVPECENACVLRLQSKTETDFASNVLGLSSTEAAQVPGFTLGQGVFVGRWVGGTNQLNTKIAPARINVGGAGLPSHWKELPEGAPNPADQAGAIVMAALNQSATAVTLVDLANLVNATLPDSVQGWFGYVTFKAWLSTSLGHEIKFASQPPGYAYLPERHEIPGGSTVTQATLLLSDKEPIANFVQSIVEFQIGSKAGYEAIFSAIEVELSENPFNLSDTSRNIRDRCSREGIHVSRMVVSNVLKGLHFAGHSFEADVDQSPSVLCRKYADFLVGVVKDRLDGTLSASDEAEIYDLVAGFSNTPSDPNLVSMATESLIDDSLEENEKGP